MTVGLVVRPWLAWRRRPEGSTVTTEGKLCGVAASGKMRVGMLRSETCGGRCECKGEVGAGREVIVCGRHLRHAAENESRRHRRRHFGLIAKRRKSAGERGSHGKKKKLRKRRGGRKKRE